MTDDITKYLGRCYRRADERPIFEGGHILIVRCTGAYIGTLSGTVRNFVLVETRYRHDGRGKWKCLPCFSYTVPFFLELIEAGDWVAADD